MAHTDHMQSFGSLSLGSRLKRLSDTLMQDVAEIYKAQGIALNPAFFPLFNLLYLHGPLAVTEAAEGLNVSHPAISKLSKKMQAEGWITKVADPSDERRQLLKLTPQSEALLLEIKPIWHEIKQHLDRLMAEQEHPLLNALNEFESKLAQQSLATSILANLSARVDPAEIEIISWDANLRDHFCALNLAWLNEYFDGELTPSDKLALYTPESYYLAAGGYIWFARYHNQIVGCVALARHDNNRYEISKMGVDTSVQGSGVGRRLILTALDKARELAAEEVYLESATKLERAIRLYKNVGFQAVPHPDGQSIYPRSDIYMRLTLSPRTSL
jgi:DNA-binding MarR family transcriptional regulator/predicted GNAT family acetyltransferase